MDSKSFYKIISFLKGASWAYISLGALVIFSIFSFSGFFTALFFSMSFIFFGLFMILFIDILAQKRQSYEDSKKQLRLLEEIRDLLK